MEKSLVDLVDINWQESPINIPFPIAVFGTLRAIPCNQGNAHLIYRNGMPILHSKGFIPHLIPKNIWLHFQEGASGLVEVFFYPTSTWPQVIKDIDLLEGFNPESNNRGYIRTLMEVRLLPDDFANEEFDKGLTWYNRDLAISNWQRFPSVPAWVYSNRESNQKCQKVKNNPVLWQPSSEPTRKAVRHV